MFPDLTPSLRAAAPDLRGRLLPNVLLSELTWLRAGGPAQLLFTPADEDDLAYFLSRCPADMPLMVMGVGSNLLVRDGGVPGVVIRLARGFNEVTPLGGTRIRAGAALPDPAAEFSAFQIDLVTQDPKQRRIAVDIDRMFPTIDAKRVAHDRPH